jgi:hypothetical protein
MNTFLEASRLFRSFVSDGDFLPTGIEESSETPQQNVDA